VWIELFTPLNQAAISPGFPTYLALWLGVGIAVDLLFGLRAWRQLTRHFRSLATRRFAPGPDAQKAARRPRRPASRKKKAIWIGSVLFLAAVAAIFAWRSSEPALPAPVVLTMTQSNAPLRVFPGPTTFFILPDGTLWRWGGTGKLRATVPQQIGGDHDWLQISGNDTDFIGLRKDGTLWKWLPEHFGDPNVELMQVDSGRDWVAAGAGIGDLVALKKDGTLWDFDMYAEFANQGRQKVPGPVQIGTNSDWKSVIDVQGTCLALKVDGTIWIWGLQLVVGTGVTYIPEPTQLCRETNWVEIGGTFGDLPWARNKSGELWQLSSAYSGPNVPVSAFGQLLATDDRPGRLAYAFVGTPQLCQLRDDGTLWQKSLSLNAQSLFVQASDDAWQRVGKRNDWVTLWSGNGTAFGMTADGAVWTWGQDWTRNGTLSASDKLKLLQARTKQSLQNTPGGLRYQMLIPAVQKTPRPLFRLRNAVPAGSDTNAAGTK
jgi:hypothetical protein